MIIAIKDAPFSEKEKEIIYKLGFTAADWGGPKVILNDPISWFQELRKELDAIPVRDLDLTKYEKEPIDRPFLI